MSAAVAQQAIRRRAPRAAADASRSFSGWSSRAPPTAAAGDFRNPHAAAVEPASSSSAAAPWSLTSVAGSAAAVLVLGTLIQVNFLGNGSPGQAGKPGTNSTASRDPTSATAVPTLTPDERAAVSAKLHRCGNRYVTLAASLGRLLGDDLASIDVRHGAAGAGAAEDDGDANADFGPDDAAFFRKPFGRDEEGREARTASAGEQPRLAVFRRERKRYLKHLRALEDGLRGAGQANRDLKALFTTLTVANVEGSDLHYRLAWLLADVHALHAYVQHVYPDPEESGGHKRGRSGGRTRTDQQQGRHGPPDDHPRTFPFDPITFPFDNQVFHFFGGTAVPSGWLGANTTAHDDRARERVREALDGYFQAAHTERRGGMMDFGVGGAAPPRWVSWPELQKLDLHEQVALVRRKFLVSDPGEIREWFELGRAEARARLLRGMEGLLSDDGAGAAAAAAVPSFPIEFVTGKPYEAAAFLKGEHSPETKIQLVTSIPLTIDKFLQLPAHEDTPGHLFLMTMFERHGQQSLEHHRRVSPAFSPAMVTQEQGAEWAAQGLIWGELQERSRFLSAPANKQRLERSLAKRLAAAGSRGGGSPNGAGDTSSSASVPVVVTEAEIAAWVKLAAATDPLDENGTGRTVVKIAREYLDATTNRESAIRRMREEAFRDPASWPSVGFFDFYGCSMASYSWGKTLLASYVMRVGRQIAEVVEEGSGSASSGIAAAGVRGVARKGRPWTDEEVRLAGFLAFCKRPTLPWVMQAYLQEERPELFRVDYAAGTGPRRSVAEARDAGRGGRDGRGGGYIAAEVKCPL